jgi:hypothetical protein
MFEQIPSYFQINISFFILLIVGVLSGLFGYYQYRQTVPPTSKSLRIFLGILRGFAFACILLLLFAPEVTAIWQKTKSGEIVLVVDKSASMGLVEKNQKRLTRALKIAQNLINQINDQAKIVIYGFDTDTTKFSNLAMDTSGLGTNINKSLRSIIESEKNVTDVVLFSDGNFSLGDNPLYSEFIDRIRLFSIGMGDTVDLPDLMITEVKSNRIVYQNQPTQIQVYVMSRGISTQNHPLRMMQGSQIIQAKDIKLNSDGQTQVVDFEVIPEKIGLNEYNFYLQKAEEEAISRNNYFTISMDVLKGKVNVGLLAAKPGYDTKFLFHLLSNQDDIQLHTYVVIKKGKYFNTTPDKFIDSLDVVILHDYPPFSQTDLRAEQYMSRLKAQGIPAMVILSGEVSNLQLAMLREFFPIKSLRYSDEIIESQVESSIEKTVLPVLSIFENEESEKKFWNISPPIQYPYSDISLESPVTILLQTKKKVNNNRSGQPVVMAHEAKGFKGVLMLGSGFWRWHFLLSEDNVYKNSWQLMLKNMIRWLDTGTVDKNVILSASNNKFQVGDNIVFNTQVYDGSFKAVNDGLIRTSVIGPSVSFEVESIFVENGRYEGSFVPLLPGRYRIRSEAWRNDIEIGTDEIELIVTTVNREYLNSKQNHRFLKRLAEKTGGKYFNETNASDLINYLNLKPEMKSESDTVELWNRLPFLLVIIFLLSLEWLIRKRKDLA